jgi:uncharacterized protein (TIGR00369 family)
LNIVESAMLIAIVSSTDYRGLNGTRDMETFKTKNPDFHDMLDWGFREVPFLKHVGVKLLDVGEGWCESEIVIEPHHLQQGGYIHAGVQSTMADHTAGGAATTLVAKDEFVLTLEFKLNLLRAARGNRLRCRARVLKPGSRFSVVESEVYVTGENGGETLTAKGMFTMAVLKFPGPTA